MQCGYAYLATKFNLSSLSLVSEAEASAGVNKLIRTENKILVPPRMAPEEKDIFGHLSFAIKHEGTNLEILSQLLPKLDASILQTAVDAAPGSAIMRKLAWLWEEFSGRQLRYEQAAGAYSPLFDPDRYFTGPEIPIPRWRITYNGLGPLTYCPIVRKVPELSEDAIAATFKKLHEQLSTVPPTLLQRAVEWAYLSETRSSFEIEKEAPSGSKAQRFMNLLRNVELFEQLDEDKLCDIQNRIVSSPYSQAVTYRSEQNWLANAGAAGVRRITYLPPPPEILDELMKGWLVLANTDGSTINPLVAAAVTSFGFVYLHPFMDGNGRLSRFLVHHQLHKGKILPAKHILPVSAAMLKNEHLYLQALETFSAPSRDLWDILQIDQNNFDFKFSGSTAIYRYWDATEQSKFLFAMIREAIDTFLPEEIDFLRKYDRIYRVLNDRFDVVQKDLDLLVAAGISTGRVSQNLKKKYLYRVPEGFFEALEQEIDSLGSD